MRVWPLRFAFPARGLFPPAPSAAAVVGGNLVQLWPSFHSAHHRLLGTQDPLVPYLMSCLELYFNRGKAIVSPVIGTEGGVKPLLIESGSLGENGSVESFFRVALGRAA